MSYTYLSLCQKLATESGTSGNASAITTVVSQTGEAKRIVGWVKDAHTEIQNRHQGIWRWLRSRWTVNTTASDDTYAGTDCTDSRQSVAVTRFRKWLLFDDVGASNVKQYLTSGGVGGEIWMTPIPYAYFMSLYKRGTQNNGVPIHVSVDPQNNLVIGPKPDGIYTLSGEYMMAPLEFSADADVPELPSSFQDVIWLKALERYGRFHAAPECISRWETEGVRVLRGLEQDQLPQIAWGSPLA